MTVNGREGRYLVVARVDGETLRRYVFKDAAPAEDAAQFLSESTPAALSIVIEVAHGYDARIAKVFLGGKEDPPQIRST